jgi:hypothetical protein
MSLRLLKLRFIHRLTLPFQQLVHSSQHQQQQVNLLIYLQSKHLNLTLRLELELQFFPELCLRSDFKAIFIEDASQVYA